MDTFILILFVNFSTAGGLTSIEFNSRADCEAAKQAALESFSNGFNRSARAVCILKSK